MSKSYKDYFYIGFIVVLTILLIIALFKNNNIFNKTNNSTIDSVLVVKEIPQKKGVFINENPQPVIVVVPSQDNTNDVYLSALNSELKGMKNSNKQRDKLLKELALRVYEKTYEDSLVKIKVRDSVNGHLQNQFVSWTIKPQQAKFYEKTKKIIPKYSFLIGAGVKSSTNFQKASLNFNIGFQNKKGNVLSAGFNTDKQLLLNYNHTIFRKY